MDQYPVGTPVLVNPTQPPARPKPALVAPSAPATGNARGSARGVGFPTIPNNRINMMTEGLMRIGGAGLAAGDDGLATYGAMLGQYGNLQDMNRQYDMDRYNAELAQAQEEQRRKELQARMAASAAKSSKPGDQVTDKEKLEGAAEIARLEGIMQDLQTMNLTGPWAGGIGNKLDGSGVMGEEAAKKTAKRKILAELQVNATLAFTAQTKGAITDREMALFQTPVPKLTEDETVWIEWLKPQLEILKQLQQNGITDEAAEQQGLTTSASTTTDDDGYTIEDVTPTNK